jgi:hypothetical protein
MTKRKLSNIRKILLLLTVSLLITLGSYMIVTGKNIPLDPEKGYSTFNGYEVILPCGSEDSGFISYKPKLPESRGLPINYNFYDPCVGHTILFYEFLSDFGFWFAISVCAYGSYMIYESKIHKKAKN